MKSYDHFNFSRASVVQFWASRYMMRLNRISEWKDTIILISREVPLFYFECVDILCAWIGHPSENLWPFEFLESSRCSITNVSIYYAPESNICMKSYDRFYFSSTFVVLFRAPRHIMRLNRTSMCKVMTILISRVLPLFNNQCLDILCTWIGHPYEKLWPFEFFEGFRCSITNVSIYHAPESDLRVKSYDHLNFSSTSVVQFRASRNMTRLNWTSVWKVMTF